MNAADPPFDPPYVTTVQTPEGVSRFETLVDGTTRPVARPAVNIAAVPASQWSAPKPASRQGAGEKTLAAAGSGGQMFLNVPFAEKDAAKSLGARWDATSKKWYVPQGLDMAPFARWNANAKQ